MPLPKMNLPDLDDFEELDEDLEEITEDNLNTTEEPDPPSYEELRKPPKINMLDDFKDMAKEKFQRKAKPKTIKKKKSSSRNTSSSKGYLKYIKVIAITLLSIIVILFIIGKFFGTNDSPPKIGGNEKAEPMSGESISITERGFIEGKPYITLTSKSDDIQVEFVETAFKNGDSIIKCTAFNPYVEEGDSIVKYDDCDGIYNDNEPMEEYIDNIKLKGEEE